MEKPKKPIQPKPNDKKYINDRGVSMRNMTMEEAEARPFIKDYRQYEIDLAKYEKDIELYEQIKLIRLIKNATEKYILNNYKIVKINK